MSTIERCPHDSENPYVMVNRDIVRDVSISPECSWFICYLLSFDKNWVIRIPAFVRMLKGKISKDKLYKALNEAIEAGYVKREEIKEKGLKKFKYFVSERPKFKKLCTRLENPDPENPDLEKPDTKNKQESLSGFKKEQDKEFPLNPPKQKREEKKPPENKAHPYKDFKTKTIQKENVDFVTKVQMTYSDLIEKGEIYIGNYYIEFRSLPEAKFYYDDSVTPFKEKVNNTLQKLGYTRL